MLTAIVSDIHSNIEALHAVMADIERRRAGRILCLGDTINYGPSPAECLRIVRRYDLVLLGNHEEAVLYQPIGFNPVAADAAKWTRRVLEPGLLSDGAKWANWNFIRVLPVKHEEDATLYVHASPREPTTEYLLPADGAIILGQLSHKLAKCFEVVRHLCFVGHTHLPGVFTEVGGFLAPDDLGGEYRIDPRGKAIINVGSVGQPRDRDPRACYVTFDGDVVKYHRIEYDAEKTCAKVRATRGLPERCGTRLLVGE